MKPRGVPAPESPSENRQGAAARATLEEEEGTGVPGFRTWTGVYWFVFGSFVLWVALLAILTEAVS
jgi:hypothetical protein